MSHIEAMRARLHAVAALPLPASAAHGSFVAPTIIEIDRVADVEREVFGPVLHVLRYRRDALDRLIDEINGSGYGLTFGLHTRIDETIARVLGRIEAGMSMSTAPRSARWSACSRSGASACRHRAEGGRPALSRPAAHNSVPDGYGG